MSTIEFVAYFKELHEKAKSGSLTPSERVRYDSARAQFVRLVMVSQQLGHAGETLRSNLRMAKMLKVELRPDEGPPLRLSTMDLASGGFAVLLSGGMKVGKSVAFTLFLPNPNGGGTTPVTGRCVVASCRPQTALFRVSFRFEALPPPVQEQLDIALIDAVLERFAKT
ncbi:MAG TPA: PilZ domain-containing protein [Labilithrix sp.]|nr:PilZ domain-containing protein [Labilithrix sp.]